MKFSIKISPKGKLLIKDKKEFEDFLVFKMAGKDASLEIKSVNNSRTVQQNKALHKDCELIAEKLNDAGLEMNKILKVDIPWTTITVKEYIIKPILWALFRKKSTTELDKVGEIEKLHGVVMRELGEKHHIEYHEFPYDPKKRKDWEDMMKMPKPIKDYPTPPKGKIPF